MLTERIKINDTSFFDTYLLNNSKEYNMDKKRPLVVICPGGGYAFTSDREAEPVALKFNSIGIHSVILRYTTGDQILGIPENALQELAKTIVYIRKHAKEWFIDEDNIIVCGFSAGGHLALNMCVNWNNFELAKSLSVKIDELKVNLAILGYPATHMERSFDIDDLGFGAKLIQNPLTSNERFFGNRNPTQKDLDGFNTLLKVDKDTPPMFIWHTVEDALVDVKHSLDLAVELRKNKIPFEMMIFEKGEHGLALCDRTTARKDSHHNSHVYKWFELCQEWLSSYIDN